MSWMGAACLASTLLGTACNTIVPGSDRLPEGTPTSAPEGEGWIDLLDAGHASKWEEPGAKRDIFTIENGVLHIPGSFPSKYVAYTGRTFQDFELHIEFKLSEDANSGVMLRAATENPVHKGMEIQVLDSYGERPHHNGAGALYDVATPMFNPSRPPGSWNSYDITLEGRQLTVVFNGFKVLDVDLAQLTMPIGKFDTPYAELPLEGHLMVQDHGGEVWYRNVRIKPLD